MAFHNVRGKNGRFVKVSGFPAPKSLPKQVTYVAIVLDKSGSMSSYGQATRDTFNNILKNIKETSENTYLTLWTFDSFVNQQFPLQDVKFVTPLTSYHPDGNTALFDGVGDAVNNLQNISPEYGAEPAYLVIVITDGYENNSTRTSIYALANKIKELQALGNWTFAFNVPPGHKNTIVNQFRVPTENVREWESSNKGMYETQIANIGSTNSYFTARKVGTKSLNDFYKPVDVDLTGVTKSVLKNNLTDISGKFKTLTVEKEQPIKEFVEQKTALPYIIGAAYYELTKTEKVQPTKNVLIMEKGKNQVWGGNEARDLIGLPTDGKTYAQVEPHNLQNYKVFITSTSVNRKLVRGTKVLLDTTKHSHSQPTWGSPTI